jgi:hypothetical protein
MGQSDSAGLDRDTGAPERPSRLDRIRPGESLVLFPLMAATVWGLVIAVFTSVSQLFGSDDERGTWGDVAGAVLGNFAMVFVLMFAISAIMRISGRRGTGSTPKSTDWGPPTRAA